MMPALVPELYVTNLKASTAFYCERLGFAEAYARPEEKFVCLHRGPVMIMLEQPAGRTWLAAPMELPFGRGINLQIEVDDVMALYDNCFAAEAQILVPLETRTYRRRDDKVSQKQFVVQDPDGYLIRLAEIRVLRD